MGAISNYILIGLKSIKRSLMKQRYESTKETEKNENGKVRLATKDMEADAKRNMR